MSALPALPVQSALPALPGIVAELLAYLASVVALLVLAAFYLSWRATRLDRLHGRVDTTKAALDAALVRRCAVVAELAASGWLDPATSLLLGEVAYAARSAGSGEAGSGEREVAESDLSRALRAVLAQPGFRAAVGSRPGGAAMLAEVDAAAVKVMLARRFHNDAVRAATAMRRRRLSRTFRLAGRAPAPAFFEIDDAPPDAGTGAGH